MSIYFLKNAKLESMAELVLRVVEPASIPLSVITELDFVNWDVNQGGKKKRNAKQENEVITRVLVKSHVSYTIENYKS